MNDTRNSLSDDSIKTYLYNIKWVIKPNSVFTTKSRSNYATLNTNGSARARAGHVASALVLFIHQILPNLALSDRLLRQRDTPSTFCFFNRVATGRRDLLRLVWMLPIVREIFGIWLRSVPVLNRCLCDIIFIASFWSSTACWFINDAVINGLLVLIVF